MILGLLSDAHGNAGALAACLEVLAAEGAERCFFLGDAVGYLPEENAVLGLLQARGVTCLRGNHEAMLLEQLPVPPGRDAVYRLSEARLRLEPRFRDWIAQWPERLELDLGGKRLLLVHGSPADPLQGYIYPDSDLSPWRGLPVAALAMGHTHRPFCAHAGPLLVLNVGSCGMPRDAGGLASCARYDTATGTAELLRVPFDGAAAALRWGRAIAPAAAAVLTREPSGPVVGRVVAA
jgi:predicted phosphodiesterase